MNREFVIMRELGKLSSTTSASSSSSAVPVPKMLALVREQKDEGKNFVVDAGKMFYMMAYVPGITFKKPNFYKELHP